MTQAFNAGDTAWMLTASALIVATVCPGLALFYGGLVRSKNALATIMSVFIVLCAGSLMWVLCGYSLAFGPDLGGVIGGLDWVGLRGIGPEPHPIYAPTVPHAGFVLFQLMFAIVAPALITGAMVERMRFSALLLFLILWSVFVYYPLVHWLWGGGWLVQQGALDFAGGAVIHTSAGLSALACALVLGRRRGYGTDYLAPHSLPLGLLGTGLLWFGWFGFCGGSAWGANSTAAAAILATNTAAAGAALSWMIVEWQHRGKPTVLGVASGAVAGLASITAGAGYVGALAALLIGLAAGVSSYGAILWKAKLGYDDPLDVVGLHGMSGLIGLLGTGIFASRAINPRGGDGLLFGNPGQFGIQLFTGVTTAVFAFVGSYVILKLLQSLMPLRVLPEEEALGLDLTQHNERAYS